VSERAVNFVSPGPPPLPLGKQEAIERAVQMRCRGWGYDGIRLAMGEYHGQWFGEHTWRMHCRANGAPRKNPHCGFGKVEA
jgi:hypothetical protein